MRRCLFLLLVLAARGGAPAERQVEIDDLVRYATIGIPLSLNWAGQHYLAPEIGRWSTDGRFVAIVVHRGNVERKTNDAQLLVYRAEDWLVGADARLVTEVGSAANHQPIAFLDWLDDSNRLMFAGSFGNARPQVYRVDRRTRKLERLTDERNEIVGFAASASGDRLVTLAAPPDSPPKDDPACRSSGCRVTARTLYDAERGTSHASSVLGIYEVGTGSSSVLDSPERTDRVLKRCDDALTGGLAPNGRFALRTCEVRDWPRWWAEYSRIPWLEECWRDRESEAPNRVCGRWLTLVDLDRRTTAPISDAPYVASSAVEPIWIDGGHYAILAGTVQSLSGTRGRERASRASHLALLLFDPLEKRVEPIARFEASVGRITAASWDEKDQSLIVEIQDVKREPLDPQVFVRKDGKWNRATASRAPPAASLPRLMLEQSLSNPPLLMAQDDRRADARLVLDPNPWLKKRKLGKVEPMTWRSKDGSRWSGELYFPSTYEGQVRYPLVIQTHGFRSSEFSMTGYGRNFATRALAGRGIAVLQVNEDWGDVNNPKTWPWAQSGYESAIDLLDEKAVIDRSRVGITGWSATGPTVGYTLTQSRYRFAAGLFADTVDYGWWMYLAHGTPRYQESNYGTSPWGAGLETWRRMSPSFNLDRVHTPMLMWVDGSAWTLWDWYAGLRRLEKPVEYWYLPEGAHDLFRVGQRLLTYQLQVDWFGFWLKSKEDPDPKKAEQYRRWRIMR